MSKEVAGTVEKMKDITKLLDSTESSLQVLEQLDYNSYTSELTYLNAAKFDLALAFTLASASFIKMNNGNVDSAKHPIQRNIQQIKDMMGRVDKIEGKGGAEFPSSSIAGENSHRNKRMKLDAGAAERMITHNL
jgi:hypothetical protein